MNVHVPDGWIDVPTSLAAGAVALASTTVAARRARAAWQERATTLPAVVAAYLLVAQLLVVPLGFGTSAHLVGAGLAALLVGPAVAIVCVAVVVVIQALVLADGGVTALGINLIDDGVVPALVTWAAFSLLARLVGRGAPAPRVALMAGVAAGLGTLAASAAASFWFLVGGTDVVSQRAVVTALGAGHVVVAVIEGVLTALVLTPVLRLRPDLVRAARTLSAKDPLPHPSGQSSAGSAGSRMRA